MTTPPSSLLATLAELDSGVAASLSETWHPDDDQYRADVYRRDRVRPRADRLAQLATLPAPSALLVSSGEAFDALWAELGEGERTLLRGRPAVASSPRLAAMLADSGFAAIVTATATIPRRMLEALAVDVAAGRFR